MADDTSTSILVTGDTHLDSPELSSKIDDALTESDLVVHVGDYTSAEVLDYFERQDFRGVYGNADPREVKGRLDRKTSFEVNGLRFTLVHGHRVSSSQEFGYIAAQDDADVLIHGHSHKPRADRGNALVLNPGSPTRPRGHPPTYCALELPPNPDGFHDIRGAIYGLDGDTVADID